MRYHVYSARRPVRMFFTLDADLRAVLEARAAADDASLSAVFNELMGPAFEPELQRMRHEAAVAEDPPLRRRDRPDRPGMTVRVDPDNGWIVLVDRDLADELYAGRCRRNHAEDRVRWTREVLARALQEVVAGMKKPSSA